MSDAEKKEKNVKLKKLVSRMSKKVKIKAKSANPAVEDDAEEIELSRKDFEKLKKKNLIINIAWPSNPVWAYSMYHTLHIVEIDGVSLLNKTVEELQAIIPGIETNRLYVSFRTKDKWK